MKLIFAEFKTIMRGFFLFHRLKLMLVRIVDSHALPRSSSSIMHATDTKVNEPIVIRLRQISDLMIFPAPTEKNLAQKA